MIPADAPDARAALEQLTAAIAAVMEEHAPTAARAMPTNFVEVARRFLVLRRAGADIMALADGALPLRVSSRQSKDRSKSRCKQAAPESGPISSISGSLPPKSVAIPPKFESAPQFCRARQMRENSSQKSREVWPLICCSALPANVRFGWKADILNMLSNIPYCLNPLCILGGMPYWRIRSH
jgi:hypothetical protein